MSDTTALSGDVDEPAKKQHEAPEYLERRRGRRRSTPGFIAGINLSFCHHFYAATACNIFLLKSHLQLASVLLFQANLINKLVLYTFYYHFFVYLEMLTHITDFAF